MDSLFEVQPFRSFKELNTIRNETIELNIEAQRKTIVIILQFIRGNDILYTIFADYITLLKKAYVINIFINKKIKQTLNIFVQPFFQKMIDINHDLYGLCNILLSALENDDPKKYYEFATMMDNYDISYILKEVMKSYSIKNIKEMMTSGPDMNTILYYIESYLTNEQALKTLKSIRNKIEELETLIKQKGGKKLSRKKNNNKYNGRSW